MWFTQRVAPLVTVMTIYRPSNLKNGRWFKLIGHSQVGAVNGPDQSLQSRLPGQLRGVVVHGEMGQDDLFKAGMVHLPEDLSRLCV
jgi:hypothetical protein